MEGLADALLPLALAHDGAAPDAALRAAAARLAARLSQRDGGPVPNPAVLAGNLRLLGLSLPVAAHRRLTALALREEKRSAMAAEQGEALEALFRAHGLSVQPVRGWDFARRYYARPLDRHCHALRWLVDDEAAGDRVAALVRAEGWTSIVAAPRLAPHKRIFSGPDRIAVEVHLRPFGWTMLAMEPDARGGAAFAAVELIGSSLVEMSLAARWPIDLAALLRHAAPDPDGFVRQVRRFGFAGHADRSLAHLARHVHSDDVVLASRIALLRTALARTGARDDAAIRDVRYLRAMATAGRAGFLLRACGRPDLVGAARAIRAERHAQRSARAAVRASLVRRVRIRSH
ncbi:nucleotidyltransferase family protein [Sphingomonas sanxanigenens]|uniref:Uncharacterized protein n=1 Tax=Sphingomonas sanxanigenens DSM 19645 = NX02 TaxID=1123269 RepID=W0A449_9SPHN|nr:nucleotidyltransferase family protein [Sphingomonas sanxanigenens]AHE51811.1 hypothetical protein NX02_00210 [Sphingomonas sanxanigenens DSM 19645 = NX02]